MKKVDFNQTYTSQEAAEITGFPAKKFPMKKFETWMLRNIKGGHDLEDMMFRPLIKWYRLHRGSDFWQLAFAACCLLGESGKTLTDDEAERLRDFADLASKRMEEEFREIGYFVTKYGWEV